MRDILKDEQIRTHQNLVKTGEYQSNDPADVASRAVRLAKHRERVQAELDANRLNNRSRRFALMEQRVSDLSALRLSVEQIADRLGADVRDVRRAMGICADDVRSQRRARQNSAADAAK